jgi:hypothetical protein
MYHDKTVVDVLRAFIEAYTQKMKLNDVHQTGFLNRDMFGARPDK